MNLETKKARPRWEGGQVTCSRPAQVGERVSQA